MKTGKATIFVLLSLFVYALLMSMQGIDFCDAGWQMTAYENILTSPEETHYSFMFWLSTIIGHYWQSLDPNIGLLWSKIGAILLFLFTLVIFKKVLSEYARDYNWLPALVILFLFIFKGSPEALHYEVLTMFFISIIVYFLYFGLTKRKISYLLLFGFFIGITIFLKISNLTYIALFAIIIFYTLSKKIRWKESFQLQGASIIGFIIGVWLIFKMMDFYGHRELFFENLIFVKKMSASGEASHGLGNLIKSYLTGYVKMTIITGSVLILYDVFRRFFSKKLTALKSKNTLNSVLLLLFFLAALFIGNPVWSKVRYVFIGLMFLMTFTQLFSKQISIDKKLLLLIGGMALVLAPIGSDSGLAKLTWGSWLLGSILIFHFEKGIFFSQTKKLSLPPVISKSIITILFISWITYAWNNPYNDIGSRLIKVHTVDHPKLRYVFTTKERATVIEETLTVLEKYVQPNDDLLAFNGIPMIHYLTDTKPFLNTSWVKLLYADAFLKKELTKAVKKKGLPIIIRQKTAICANDWFDHPIENYTSYENNSIKYKSQGIILNNFMDKNGYISVWENEVFEILKPVKKDIFQ